MAQASATPILTALGRRGLLRWSRRDAWLVAAAIAQGAISLLALLALPGVGLGGALAAAAWLAVSIWWGSNTVSHNHLHNPLFHSRALNRVLSLYLSVIYAVPQSMWRERHIVHHAGPRGKKRARLARGTVAELALIAIAWGSLAALAPRVLLPAIVGYALAMGLCRLQGNMEHALAEHPERGISHYGRLHNLLWFNDGYHAEHHRWPGLHWTRLPERRSRLAAVESRFSPAFRFVELWAARLNRAQGTLLGWLEQLPFALPSVRGFMIETHARAFSELFARMPVMPETIAIVGGGLFPRTLLVMRRLLPDARLTIIDASAANVERARAFLAEAGVATDGIEFRVEPFQPSAHGRFDLVIIPLGFVGDRAAVAAVPGFVITHDWAWRRARAGGVIVSWLLLKRLNLHLPAAPLCATPPALVCEAA